MDGFEQGISSSPYTGIANIQGGNISTELGEVSVSFNRVKQTQTPIANGTLTASVADGTTVLAVSSALNAGQWIDISASTINGTPLNVTSKVLVVAGGGGGGNATDNQSGGGGGAGGVKENDAVSLTVQSYAIVVGAGGAANTSGSDSSFTPTSGTAITSTGGGAGGQATGAGSNGGSGGGGSGRISNATPFAGGTGASGQGHDGGAGGATATGSTVGSSGGGGGGATAVGTAGSSGSSVNGAAGGAGVASTISGASVTYGGGGGSGAAAGSTQGSGTSGGAGGAGGGGAGGNFDGGTHNGSTGTAGTANTGGGGGGGGSGYGGSTSGNGGAGGSGVVIISAPQGYINATGGSHTTSGGNDIWTFTSSGTFTITSFNSVVPLNTLNGGRYFIDYRNSSDKIKLSFFYDPTGASPVVHTTSGTATFTTVDFANPVAKATEVYSDGTQQQNRYYVLDSNARVWVYDTALYASTLAANGVGMTWFLPDASTTYWSGLGIGGTAPSGMAVLDGNLIVLAGTAMWFKPTVCLGDTTSNTTTYLQANVQNYSSICNSPNPHFALVGHQGRMDYTDGNIIGSLFPNTSIVSGNPNIQSYGTYTPSGTAAQNTIAISGARPYQIDATGTTLRVPAFFFASPGGSIPPDVASAQASAICWIDYASPTADTFNVYADQTGGAAISLNGSSGTQYFNTFYPYGSIASTLYVSSGQRVNLPSFEVATRLVEISNTVLIGCQSNAVYPWNQVDVTPSGLISLPESNVAAMITVNQMAYIFAGNKGNVYITDGSVASLVIKVPDYCAGVPGSPSTYIEPSFTWKDAAYIRGRVYFSILDQTSTKAGNCGGIWSFVPTQNLYIGQDTGLALRLENQNSYGSYNGAAALIIPNFTQNANQPLFWSAWYSNVTNPTYGIDYSNSGTSASFPLVIETDMIPSGTFLNNKTFQQLEYKLASALDTGATITANYRVDPTAAWASAFNGGFITDNAKIGAYAAVDFEQTQWVQFQFIVTPVTSTASTNTFCRVREFRLR